MKAWELLSDPGKWTTGHDARDANGHGCKADDPAAVCWCLRGAVLKCHPGKEDRVGIWDKIHEAVGYVNITYVNDSGTYEKVHGLLKKLDV